ncbi:MAG: ATP-binding cassette domain-containing protein [Clostridiales bacterium]|nr:ATP-binding cassette domain-containing protein [Clostridiales bacterium]
MKVVLQNITKIFASRNKKVKDEVIAVNDFNLEIPDGKLVCLLGPSGCGKSTTLYMISGLQEPSSGKIFFGDDDVTKLSPENRGIGLVFQNYALYPHMTVQQNILFPLQNLKGENKLSKEEMLTRASEAAKLVQIEEYMDRKPSELSGGQQQRVAIARALVKMPRVLLLDEPLSNLDARLRLQTREEIRRIQRRTQITTIFVTHDQEEAMSISDYIVIMKLGVIMQTGKPQWVYDDPANLFVAKFLGAPPINLFSGKVESGKLYIGEECVLDVGDVEDQEVYVGIRPEGFILDKEGKLSCTLSGIDVMGRDISVVSTCESSLNPVVRSIISADEMGNIAGGGSGSSVDRTTVSDGTDSNADEAENNEDVTVKFNLKPHKVLIFNKETERRVYFGDQLATHEQMVAQMEAEGQGYVTHNGPLPREADDVDKKATLPERKKNVFVRAFGWVKGLFSKNKESDDNAEQTPEAPTDGAPAADEAPADEAPAAENVEQTAAVVEAMAPSPEAAANEPAPATDAAPEAQSAPEVEEQAAVADSEPVVEEQPVETAEKPTPAKKAPVKKTTTAKKPATTKKPSTTAKKTTTAKKSTTTAKKPATTTKKSTNTAAKKPTTAAKKSTTTAKKSSTTSAKKEG